MPQHVLRFWETKFPQIKPLKRGGGRRYYRPEDIELIRDIRSWLYEDGYTIKGVQKLLRENGGKDARDNGLKRHDAPESPGKMATAQEASEPASKAEIVAEADRSADDTISIEAAFGADYEEPSADVVEDADAPASAHESAPAPASSAAADPAPTSSTSVNQASASPAAAKAVRTAIADLTEIRDRLRNPDV